MNYLRLLSDEAFGEGTSLKPDGLEFDTYASVLANAAVNTAGPFTIGIFGDWGTGKTTLMRMIERRIKDEPTIVTVWFNAWRYDREEHPLIPLIATIVATLSENRSLLGELKEHGARVLRALRAVAYGFSAKSKVSVPGFAEVEASFVAKDMIEREDKLAHDALLDKAIYHNAFDRLSIAMKELKLRIVVLVDDLDRCMPDRAIDLLESIKLVLCQPNLVFVLGVARKVLEGYLNHLYRREYGLEKFEGRAYLDKIVQLPFQIPSHENRMEGFCAQLVASLDLGADGEAFREILPIVGVACGGNPRSTIRFVNNLLIDREICRSLAMKQSGLESIPIGFFAMTRALQLRWYEVYLMLEPSVPLCNNIEQSLREGQAPASGKSALSVYKQIEADRQLRGLLSSSIGMEWLAKHDMRNATDNFLLSQRRGSALPEPAYEFDVLLSYSPKDKDIARRITKILKDDGVLVCEIRDAAPGLNPRSAALSGSCSLVFLVSKNTEPNGAVVNDLKSAADLGRASSMIAIYFDGATADQVPFEGLSSVPAFQLTATRITHSLVQPIRHAIMRAKALAARLT